MTRKGTKGHKVQSSGKVNPESMVDSVNNGPKKRMNSERRSSLTDITDPANDKNKQADIVTVRLDGNTDFEEMFQAAKSLSVKVGVSSIIGTRSNQQDTVRVVPDDEGKKVMAIVCDGMGGMNGGEIASQTAADMLAKDFELMPEDQELPEFFRQEAVKMDRAVASLTNAEGEPLNGGTTVVAVVIDGNKLHWLSVGDSKIYIIRGDVIRGDAILAVNREHNYRLQLNEELKAGMITEEEYHRKEDQAEALISYIGMGNVSLMDINTYPFELMEDDAVLLCSDGLYKRLPDQDILEIINLDLPDVKRAAKRLTDVVMMRTQKTQDNTSLVLLQYNRY